MYTKRKERDAHTNEIQTITDCVHKGIDPCHSPYNECVDDHQGSLYYFRIEIVYVLYVYTSCVFTTNHELH